MGKGLKIGSATIATLGVVGLIAFLIFKVYGYRDDLARAEWLLAAKEAENDTLKIIGQYSVPETVLVSRVRYDTTKGRIDTLYEDIPTIYGSIEIDTTKEFGPESNPLSVRVWGQLWYPAEYSYKNRLLIHPVAGTPYKPVARRSPDKWGLGIVYIRSVSGANAGYAGDYLGASVAYKRLVLSAAYDPWRKGAIGGFGLKVWGF